MLTEEQVDKCRGLGFIPLPPQIKVDEKYAYYKCPFCDTNDHYACVAVNCGIHDARPIHCFITRQMAWVIFVSDTIKHEEQIFRDLLGRIEIKPLPAHKAVIQWHSRGVPYEIAEEMADDQVEFRRLVEEHRAISKAKISTVY